MRGNGFVIIGLPIGGSESGLLASASVPTRTAVHLHGLVVGQAGLLSLEALGGGQIVL